MSYARFSDSDIYLYAGGPGWVCCSCNIQPLAGDSGFNEDAVMLSIEKVWEHVQEHLAKGDRVGSYCIDRIKREMGVT